MRTFRVPAGLALALLSLLAIAVFLATRETSPERPVALHETARVDRIPVRLRPARSVAPEQMAKGPRDEPRHLPLYPMLEFEPVHGRVTDEAGRPIPGAHVRAIVHPEERYTEWFRGLLEPEIRSTVTEEDGRYSLAVEWPAPFHVSARKDGYAPSESIALAGEEVDFVLSPGTTLSARVVDPERRPIDDAELRLLPTDGRLWEQRARTDSDGVARFTGIPPGPARILGLRPPFVAGRIDFELVSGSVERIEIQLERGPGVFGVVLDAATGSAISGARVVLHHLEYAVATTGADGSYRIDGLGLRYTWEVHATASGYSRQTGYVRRAGDGEDVELDFLLEPGRSVRGRVLALDRGVAEARVVAHGYYGDKERGAMEEDRAAVLTGEDGFFRLNGLRRDVRHSLLVSRPGFARVVHSVEPGAADDVDLGDIVLAPGAILEGVAVDTAQALIEGLRVRLTLSRTTALNAPSDPDYFNVGHIMRPVFEKETTVTGPDGRFCFVDLPAGTYRLETDGPPFASTAREVEVPYDQESVDLVLAEGVVLEGRVRAASGAAVEGARIQLKWSPSRESQAGATQESTSVRSAEDGTYAFHPVPPGVVTLTISKTGFERLEDTLSLRREDALSGRVRHELVIETPAERAQREVAPLAERLGWESNETRLVVDLFANETSEANRRQRLTEIVGSEMAERFLEARRIARRNSAVEQAIRSIDVMMQAVGKDLPRDRRELVLDALRSATSRIVDLAFAIDDKRPTSWRETLGEQQSVADELRSTLRGELGSALGNEVLDDVYGQWRRIQPVPLR